MTAKQAGVGGRRKDKAAAKNGDYERSVQENQIKRKNGRREPMVALPSCWRQTARKRGSIQEDTVQKWYQWLASVKLYRAIRFEQAQSPNGWKGGDEGLVNDGCIGT